MSHVDQTMSDLVCVIRYCAVSLFLLLTAGSVVTAQVAATNQDIPIQIRLKPDKKEIMLGEPLFIAFEVTNVSGEKLCLGVGGDYRNKYGRPDRFKVSVRTEAGAELPQLEVMNFGGFIGCNSIEVGATYTVRLFLPHWVTIERTGSYRVNVKREMGFTDEAKRERSLGDVRRVSEKAKYSFTADVSAEFVVVPADENKMGGVITSLGSVMLDSSDPRADESAQALASIQDKRVISYFAEALRKFANVGDDFAQIDERNIRSRSAAVLAEYDDDRAIEALQSVMNRPNQDLRLSVATAFGESPHKSAIGLLLKMQDDEYWFVRLRVAQGLGKVKTIEARAVLQKLLKDEHEDVRKAAAESLKN